MKKLTQKRISRVIAMLLVFAMLLTLAPLAFATGSNASLELAVEERDRIPGLPQGLEESLDFRGRFHLFGDIDVADLLDEFPNLSLLDVRNTNVTHIANVPPTGFLVLRGGTFYSGDRGFAYDPDVIDHPTIVGDLGLDVLLPAIDARIVHLTGPDAGSTIGMVTPDMLGIPEDTVIPGRSVITVTPVSALGVPGTPVEFFDGYIPADFLNSLPTRFHHYITLNFPMAYSEQALTNDAFRLITSQPIELNLIPSGYQLNPEEAAVVPGGSANFYFFKTDANLQYVVLDPDEYEVIFRSHIAHRLVETTHVDAQGRPSVLIQVFIDEPGAHSAWLYVYRRDRAPGAEHVARGQVIVSDLAAISQLRLREYRYTDNDWAMPSGVPAYLEDEGTLHVLGGTSISSAEVTRAVTYNGETRFYLRAQTMPGAWAPWDYLPALHATRINVEIDAGVNVDYELISVPHPNPSRDEMVLALVFRATTFAPEYHAFDPADPPIRIWANNGLTQSNEIEVGANVMQSQPVGYVVYQVSASDTFRFMTRSDMEAVLNLEQGHDRITRVAHLVPNAPGSSGFSSVDIRDDGVSFVEEGRAFLVAVGYFQVGGRRFLLPDDVIMN